MVKKIITVIYIIVFLGLLVQNYLGTMRGYGVFISPLTYWAILGFWVYKIYEKKYKSERSLSIAYGLFIFAAFCSVIGINFVSEIAFRVSFIGWFIGISEAFLEYFRLEKNK